MIIFNEVTEDIVEEKHVCFYTVNEDDGYIVLKEVLEKKLKHPKAKELAYVFKLDTKIVYRYKRIDSKAAASILLEAAQNNLKES